MPTIQKFEEEIITLLSEFVGFETVEGNEKGKKQCLDWILKTFLKTEGREQRAEIIPGTVEKAPYLYLKHPNPTLLFFAHIDVVPAEDHQFTLRREGDKLIGRGTRDMKGNQLAFLLAYRDLCSQGIIPPVNILFSSDEETAGPTIPTLLQEGMFSDIPVAYTPDTGPEIVCEHKGAVWADLVCAGKSAHAAYAWEGKNPCFLLADALQNLQHAFPPGSADDWHMTVTPTQLRGAGARNQIPESAVCGIDCRYTPEEASTPEEVLALVRPHLPNECELIIQHAVAPLHTDPNHPMIQHIKSIAEEVTGTSVHFRREHGGTDARYFGAHGIPAFLYGAAGGGLHSKDEWVSLKSLQALHAISTELLKSLVMVSTGEP